MINLRFTSAVMLSLVLHYGFVYYSLLTNHDFAKISSPINAAVITIAVTQSAVEKHIFKVAESQAEEGEIIRSQVVVAKAKIDVSKEQSKTHKDNKLARKQADNHKLKKTQEFEPKKLMKSKQLDDKSEHDEIEQQLKQGTGQAESRVSGELGEQKTTASGENTNDAQLKYLAKVRNELERHKKYPRRARAMQIEGLVVVHFQITPQGELINAYVVESKYSEVFGKAVLDAVKRYKSVGEKPTSVNAFVSLEIRFNLDK